MLAADSVAINRLHVKGDKHTSQTLVRELEQTSWAKPLPAHLQHAWILVRELSVRGKARDLRQQTAQHLDAELNAAVRAIQGNADTANAIWFASFPELLAFLLIDLALGKTTQWYWSHWAHLLKYPRHEAIVRLLCEHIEYMPAAIMQLHNCQQLPIVFARITEGGARTLVRELARVWGFPDPVSWHTQSSIPDVVVQDVYKALKAQTVLLAWWKPLLQGLSALDGRIMLVTALHGLIYTPLWLRHQPSALVNAVASLVSVVPKSVLQSAADKKITKDKINVHLNNLQSTMPDNNNEFLPASTKEAISGEQLSMLGRKKSEQKASLDNIVTSYKTEPKNNYGSDTSSFTYQQHSNEIEKSEHLPREINSVNAVLVNSVDDSISTSVTSHQPEGYQFITCAGGFFYLLNPLRLLLTQDRLATQTESSVWYWLLDLYRLFTQEFPLLEGLMDEPLQGFILQQLHPEATHHELQKISAQMMSLAPGEFALQLFADLRAHYQHTDFWQELNDAEGFFATPARVVASASHWDIYFPLSSVRLDVRLVGWDVNPGWLPWLGRVVAFHYVETPIVNAPVLEKVKGDHYES